MKKPTREELLASVDLTVEDVIAADLRVLFCGINPGLYTAATGHHFARPGNRFWPALHASGFTPRLLAPDEKGDLLALGLGITNVASRTTSTADQLTKQELLAGGRILREKVRRYRPAFLAVLGVGAYRTAFDRPRASLGEQAESIESTRVWVLPNPSGLNAHYQAAGLAELFRELRLAVESGERVRPPPSDTATR
ncbi:MAG: G/U mismatch-specific DNA glycosylase [Gemmatimonadetes bacterium]|nr:G/U mismatch-specific DNA glycosylase [Gemmatimonadota bacterium]